MERTVYTYRYRERKENPDHIIRWCRRNFGNRGEGWDFILASFSGEVHIAIWDPKLEATYLLFKY